MRTIEELTTYELIEKRDIADLNSVSYVLKHKKTGARIALLSNDDENKVFYIGFRTPPMDSTGVPHILEHSVLCGSKHFPVKDPFVELVQGSLNTFLNAMTYPDKTVYPVASCNDKDFQNLMHVYLDAVFYPNCRTEKKIFCQEGWHYDLENAEDELTLNGVVYNEMKGAFSSPDDVLEREIFNSLFPDTAYGYESGGDPAVIPELTYEEFTAFHAKYYHPSNSYIYLYGNMDMVEKLEWMDKEYLSAFEAIVVDSEIATQQAFTEEVTITKQYSISESESERDNTYLSYNTVVGTSLDRELYIAFQVLDYVLCSAPGAPLKLALTQKGIGTDIYSVYDNGVKQPYFSVVAKNANVEQKEEFLLTVKEVLQKLVTEGIDKKALQAALNYYEFKYREADFGSYPKGLMYGLQALDSWLYDERAPYIHVEANDTYRILKEKIDTDYYEKLIQDYLLDNSHKSIVIVEPVKGLTAKEEVALKEKLQAYKATLSAEEIAQIIADTKALEEYQEKEDTPEAIQCIPLLTREDMKKEAENFVNEEKVVEDVPVLFHDIFTNEIGYVRLIFSLDHIDAELFQYVGLLKAVLGLMDTKTYSYGDFFNEINIHTGGITTSVSTYVNAQNLSECKTTFEIKGKALYHNMDKLFALMQEMILSTRYEDTKRLAEIIAETKSKVQSQFTGASHSLAAVRAMSYFSKPAAISEQISGIPFFRMLEKMDAEFDTQKDNLITKLKELTCAIFRPENLMIDYTADEKGFAPMAAMVGALKEKLFTTPVEKKQLTVELSTKNEGYMTSSQVQYVCRAGNFIEKGHNYTGALRVLKVIMGYDYLWNHVRVKGGAYGCMCAFGKSGDSYFVSYRDPNLTKTLDTYQAAADYIRAFEADERTITKFIIGAVSDLDTPMTPMTKGSRSLGAYLSHVTYEDIQKEREELLTTTPEVIRGLADYIEAFMESECICVVGNEDKIKEAGHLFTTTENLFH
ncbi:MAG: insulinase family protein [Lachnospiraceae bacterium]|nr:insulinase family protein [Lachnospiraceae bacterium]